MNLKTIVKNLNKNVDIIESTFSALNLHVIGYGFCGIIEHCGHMQFLLEVTSLDGKMLDGNVGIKVNLYNAENVIIYSEQKTLYEEYFNGYDTLAFYFHEDNIAYEAVKSRVFATRE